MRRSARSEEASPLPGSHKENVVPRCEDNLMQPGELSRVKEHTPKGVATSSGLPSRWTQLTDEGIAKSRPRGGEVVHFSTGVHIRRADDRPQPQTGEKNGPAGGPGRSKRD